MKPDASKKKCEKDQCEKDHCDWPTMSQLPVCKYHYSKSTWWEEWADSCYHEHPEAKRKERQ